MGHIVALALAPTATSTLSLNRPKQHNMTSDTMIESTSRWKLDVGRTLTKTKEGCGVQMGGGANVINLGIEVEQIKSMD